MRLILLWSLFSTSLLLAACTAVDEEPVGQNTLNDKLVFERQDGSIMVMGGEAAVCCGDWEPGDARLTLKVLVFDSGLQQSFWKLFLVLEDAEPGSTYTFPSSPSSTAHLFVGDVGTYGSGQVENEISSSLQNSSGWVRIEEFDCGPPLRVSFTIEANLASEFHLGSSVEVIGTFSADIEDLAPCTFGF